MASPRDNKEWTPLHFAAQTGSKECVETLIDNGAYVNARDKEGDTPLHAAAANGSKECTETLIVNGADVNARDEDSWTPLHAAATNGSKECIETLIVNGADVNARYNKEWTPLHFAAQKGSKECVETLIDNGAYVNARDKEGDTPLHAAAANGSKECTETLIVNGADVNARDEDRWTPLHAAATNGSKECIETLIVNGADVNARNIFECTPLHYAAVKGSIECVEILIANGADVHARNAKGFSPLDIAVANGHMECVEILERNGVAVNYSECIASEQSILKGSEKFDGKGIQILQENQPHAVILNEPVELTRQDNDPDQNRQTAGKMKSEDLPANSGREKTNTIQLSIVERSNKKRYRPPKEACRYDGRLILLSDDDKREIIEACKQENMIGRGGFGTVFKHNSDGFGMDIAIKKIIADEENKKNSARKEMFASRILHPFILPLFATFEERTRLHSEFYFIWPYCEKGDLHRNLKERDNPLNKMQRLRIALQIALAIQYLHTPIPNVRGIIFHKDISSNNIVLDISNNARLIDFGLAREKDDMTTTASGKWHYQHPDVGQPGKLASVVWDYYSFGVVIRELLTDLPPSGNKDGFLKYMSTTYIKNNLAPVWDFDDEIVVALNSAAEHCLHAKEGSFSIEKNVIGEMKSVLQGRIRMRSERKCCMWCLINPDGSEAAKQMSHLMNCHDSIRLCVACERNSFLNPVACYSCGAALEPIIGSGWGALLVAGNDIKSEENAKAFKEDVEKVRKLIISRVPLVFGIREENVKIVALEKTGKEAEEKTLIPNVRMAIEEIQALSIHTLIVYFSCHGSKDGENHFQLASKNDKLTIKTLNEMLSSLTQVRKVIVFLDRCFADKLTLPGKTIVQFNACGSNECAPVRKEGSPFTKFLLKGLQAFSEGNICETAKEKCKDCTKYFDRTENYITVESLLEFVASHMEAEGHPKPQYYIDAGAFDVKLAYYTDEEILLDFTEDGITKLHIIPVAFCQNMDDLKTNLLSTFHDTPQSDLEVYIKQDTYRKENRYEPCDTIDQVMMAWILRKRLIVQFLERGSSTETTVLYQRKTSDEKA